MFLGGLVVGAYYGTAIRAWVGFNQGLVIALGCLGLLVFSVWCFVTTGFFRTPRAPSYCLAEEFCDYPDCDCNKQNDNERKG